MNLSKIKQLMKSRNILNKNRKMRKAENIKKIENNNLNGVLMMKKYL